jgi:hypothetical protein
MRSVSVAIALGVTALAAGGAGACYFQAQKLRTEGRWLMERGNAQAEEYAASLDKTLAETQLATFEERRAVLEQAHFWQRLQVLLIVVAAIGGFCSYVLYLFRRLREQLVDAAAPLDDVHTTQLT